MHVETRIRAVSISERSAAAAGVRRSSWCLWLGLGLGAGLWPSAAGAQAGTQPLPEPAQAETASAETSSSLPEWVPRLLGAQFTFIGQDLRRFHAAYSGRNSLRNDGDAEQTDTYGMYFGSQLTARWQFYFDVEMARGAAVGHATGLAGITNGDVIRQGSIDLGQAPYVARAYLRYVRPLPSGGGTETAERGDRLERVERVERSMDHVPGREPASRLEVKLGKFALTDDFDQNRYANSTRNQFMNWSLFNNTAWDYAADTRGYTNGIMAAWVHPRWALRAAIVQMPSFANGNVFDSQFPRARGDNLELTLGPAGAAGTIVRLLAYENHGRMGRYAAAVARARATGTVPDVVADDKQGRGKVGFGLNLEQPLADGGETGVFLRAGWNDGRNEDFAFTEVDRHLSFGAQVSGSRWRRAEDRLGAGLMVEGISRNHRDYLAAGGLGFLLGDGRLRYGYEEVAELYYRVQAGKWIQVSPDVQRIRNPGYNRDRGPVTVFGLRVNLRY
jgi:high affinity Mn2+ porin